MVCGCEILMFVAIPAAVSAWPTVVAAATAAASALGFYSAQTALEGQVHTRANVEAGNTVTEVDLPLSHGEAVTQDLVSGREVHFHGEGIELIFCRNLRGKAGVRVRGSGKTREELEAMGQAFCGKLAQNYAYHRMVTKLRQQNFHIDGEEVADNGTVHIQARIYRED
ncbi:MAG: DUF1257 domain-containing protein [Planctomycetes bacterium]|nr:DUF1257 domain-containing protein [Planctomycetota bacterium]